MSTARPTIAVLSGTGENDAINGLMRSVSAYCERGGLQVEYFDLAAYDQKKFFALMSSGRVHFALTYLGIGQNLEVELKSGGKKNIWEFFNIPFLKLHGDLPAYFLERHLDTPLNSVNLYGAEEFLDYLKFAVPQGLALSGLFEPWLIDDCPPTDSELQARRSGRLFLIKNGGDPDALIANWEASLPPALSRQLTELAREAEAQCLKAGRIALHRLVVDFLDSKGIELRGDAPLLSFYVAQMDDYLRKFKSTLVGRALLNCPVVIQGSRWEHLDRSGARAEIIPAQDFGPTAAVFRSQLGVIDISPNLDSSCHDRMMRAAGSSSFVLSNRSSWLGGLLPELNEAAFEFDPEHIRHSVETVLAHPDRFVELGLEYGRVYRQRHTPEGFVGRLNTLAEMARLRHARQKPVIQPHIVW